MSIVKLKTKSELTESNINDNKKSSKRDMKKATPTIFARDLKIEGDISSSGLIEIEGEVKGTIKGNSIIIREDGVVIGDVIAESLNIRGKFEGNIKARNINISSKAFINGVIEYCSLCVEDGASVDGQFKKVEG